MIIRRHISREVAATAIAVALLLLAILLSGTFIRILREVGEGSYPADMLLTIFAYKALSNLVLILPLAFLLGTMAALGRLNRDSEMVVMQSCGVSPWSLLGAIMVAMLPVFLLAALLNLWFTPWAEERVEQLQDEARAESGVSATNPGQFQAIGHGAMLYVGEAATEGARQRGQVFLLRKQGTEIDLLVAEGMREWIDPQTAVRQLALATGEHYQGTLGSRQYQVTRFAKNDLQIGTPVVKVSTRRDNAIPTRELWYSVNLEDIGELQWRISQILMVPILALLAFPLSRSAPRQGGAGGAFLCGISLPLL
ncbi:MAG: LPS export ABC transporter permease LptF [Gammaproteobacteria bacterium]|nr:LPS export ABC transporter permease LptF [Gammaproteobacteria bacterium]